MAYTVDLFKSAHRHHRAAKQLDENTSPHLKNKAVAGYLYGVAAECALKHIMHESGMRPNPPRRDDPFYAHFPELKTLLRDSASGRRAQELMRYANDNKLMSDWDVSMRYGSGNDVTDKFVTRWSVDAKKLVDAMEGV